MPAFRGVVQKSLILSYETNQNGGPPILSLCKISHLGESSIGSLPVSAWAFDECKSYLDRVPDSLTSSMCGYSPRLTLEARGKFQTPGTNEEGTLVRDPLSPGEQRLDEGSQSSSIVIEIEYRYRYLPISQLLERISKNHPTKRAFELDTFRSGAPGWQAALPPSLPNLLWNV